MSNPFAAAEEIKDSDASHHQAQDNNEGVALNESLSMDNLKISVDLKPNQYGIAVRIVDNFSKEESFNRYTLYVVKGFDTTGAIEVARRYSDFLKIRDTLLMRWPGCYIPPIPGKNVLNNMDAHFIRERRIGLDLFLQKMAEISYLYNSKEFQTFLRYSGSEFSKEIKVHQNIYYDEMVSRYAETFQHLAQIQSADEATVQINRFKSFLHKMTGKFKTYKNVAREAVRGRRAYYMGLVSFQTIVAADYEKEAIMEYQNQEGGNTVFYQQDNNIMNTKVQKIKEALQAQSIEHFYNWLNAESLEIEALIDAIKQKEKIDAIKQRAEDKVKSLTNSIEAITAGKFHWKTILSTKSKEAEVNDIQGQIAQTQKVIESLTLLGDMIVLILAYEEIKKFKTNKAENFYNLVGNAAQSELESLATINDYWTTVLKNNSGRNAGAPVLE